MNDVGRVEVLETDKQVIHHGVYVFLLEVYRRLYYFFQVTFRQLQHQVDCVEVARVLWFDKIEQSDNTAMFEGFEDENFP